jgi:thiol-disulfide isomerase/thioredoxin
MKKLKLHLILCLVCVFNCIGQSAKIMKVSISGLIKNHFSTRNIHILSADDETYLRGANTDFEIIVSDKGSFSSSLELPVGSYSLKYYTSKIFLDLTSGNDLQITFDALNFINTINFTGNGYELNQLRADERRLYENATKFYTKNEIVNFEGFIKTYILDEYDSLCNKYLGVFDQEFLDKKKKSNKDFFKSSKWLSKYKSKLESDKSIRLLLRTNAPDFSYLDSNDEIVKLSDFYGKYVVIDLWATWCAPCLYQFPFYEKTSDKFREENIAFLSISIDKKDDKGKWREMIKQKQLKGIQLFEGQDKLSEFMKIIKNNSIPRYILIDPKGRFVNLDLPKPITSDLEYFLINLF